MSATKRLLFDKSPELASARAVLREKLDELQSRLQVRIPTRRKNPLFGRRRWDPLWPSSLRHAADDLGIEAVMIKDGLFVGSETDAKRVVQRAQEVWEANAAKLRRPKEEIEF